MAGVCKAVQDKPKSLELTGVKQLPENTNCLTCTEDGRFLGLAHTQGLSVWCASSYSQAAEWLQPQLEMTFIQMSRMAEMTYLLGTVDDMGVARLFGFHSDVIHLLSVINVMEDINLRSIFLTFDLHESGHYGAASVSCNGAVWLEVFQFPVEPWRRELDVVRSQKKNENMSGGSDVTWSPVTLMMKISSPTVPAGQGSSFLTHCLALDSIRRCSHQKEQSFFSSDALKTKKAHKSLSNCTQHFLLPCDQLSGGSEARPDVTSLPDILWPNSKEILCSAVSRCSSHIALGLEDAMLCIWDRRSGAPLSIILVPEETRALSRVQCVDSWSAPKAVPAEPVGVLALFKSGAIYTVTAGQGMQSHTMQVNERPKESRDLPTLTIPVPFLKTVLLLVQRSGEMFLKDAIYKAHVCKLTLPTSYQIASPYNPVYTLNVKHQVLYMRGDKETRCSDLSKKKTQSQLCVFHFSESDIIKPHVVSRQDPPRQQTTLCHGNLEEICNFYRQQRVHSMNERNKALGESSRKLRRLCIKHTRATDI